MPKVIFNGIAYQVSDDEAQSLDDLMQGVVKGVELGFTWVFTHVDSTGKVPVETSHKCFVSCGTSLTIIDWP